MDIGFDVTGSYVTSVWVLAGLLLLGTVLILLLPEFSKNSSAHDQEVIS